MFSDWATFSRVFENKLDTWWWLGEDYYKKNGQVWPHAGKTPPEGYVYPDGEGLKLAILLAILLTIVRFTFEKLIAEPLGVWVGLRHQLPGTPAGPNPPLEAFIAEHKKPSPEEIKSVAKTTGLSVREVEVWIRRKQRELMPSKLNKFKEAVWRLLFYSILLAYGVATLWKEDFTWNTMLCWVGFPELIWGIKKSIYYYYLMEGSFYLSLMVSQFFDTKRKDFWEMFLHHIATLALIGGSYFGGTYRVGALVMVIHDVADVFLEAAKISVYVKNTFWSNSFFAGFTVSFFTARLVLFPFKILNCAIFEAGAVTPNWPVHIIYTGFLIMLQVLHIYWFTFIVKLLIKIAAGNDVNKDDRSEDDTPPSSEAEQKKDQ